MIQRVVEDWKIGRFNIDIPATLGRLVMFSVPALPLWLVMSLVLPENFSVWRLFSMLILFMVAYSTLYLPYNRGRQLRQHLDPGVFDKIRQYAVK